MLKPPGQPFTFSGVARYADARFGRLLMMGLIFALLPAAIIGRLAAHCWWPVISDAVEKLPDTARIERGALQVQEKDSRLLAMNQFLCLQLARDEFPQQNAPVDLALLFGKYEVMVSSLLGDSVLPYPE